MIPRIRYVAYGLIKQHTVLRRNLSDSVVYAQRLQSLNVEHKLLKFAPTTAYCLLEGIKSCLKSGTCSLPAPTNTILVMVLPILLEYRSFSG